jgi:hypothetical protein
VPMAFRAPTFIRGRHVRFVRGVDAWRRCHSLFHSVVMVVVVVVVLLLLLVVFSRRSFFCDERRKALPFLRAKSVTRRERFFYFLFFTRGEK